MQARIIKGKNYIDHSAPLREAGAKCCQKKRRSRDQGRIDQKTQVFY